MPGADLRFACFSAMSNSVISNCLSSSDRSWLESLLSSTVVLAQIVGPKKSSIEPSTATSAL